MKLLKRSVPAWVILASLLVFGIALGAFILTLNSDIVMQADDGPQAAFSLTECRIEAGDGTLDSAVLAGSNLDVSASGLTNDSQIYCAVLITNNDSVVLNYDTVLPDPLPAGVSSVFETGTSGAIAPAGSATSYIIVHLLDLAPGQLIDTFQYTYDVWE